MIYTETFFCAGNQNVRGKTQLNYFSLLFSSFSLTFIFNAFLSYPTQKKPQKVYFCFQACCTLCACFSEAKAEHRCQSI